jgi:hypothetical protein
MTTFSNLKTYLSLAFETPFQLSFQKSLEKTEYYCNISVRSINGTADKYVLRLLNVVIHSINSKERENTANSTLTRKRERSQKMS